MELKQAIEEAKQVAKSNYDNSMKKVNCHNPNYVRTWREEKFDDGRIAYALTGTPDKAFVVVSADKKIVCAYTINKELLKKFKVTGQNPVTHNH